MNPKDFERERARTVSKGDQAWAALSPYMTRLADDFDLPDERLAALLSTPGPDRSIRNMVLAIGSASAKMVGLRDLIAVNPRTRHWQVVSAIPRAQLDAAVAAPAESDVMLYRIVLAATVIEWRLRATEAEAEVAG